MGRRINDWRTIGFDSTIWIYLFEENKEYVEIAVKLVYLIELGKSKGVFSVLGLTEVLNRPKKLNDQAMVDFYKNSLVSYEHLKVVNVDQKIAEEAAELRSL